MVGCRPTCQLLVIARVVLFIIVEQAGVVLLWFNQDPSFCYMLKVFLH